MTAPATEDLLLFADNLPTLAWIANGDGFITWYNKRWHAYCGTTPADMEGWGWQSVHDPAVLPQVLERWRASIATGESFEMVFPLRGADGVFRPFLTRIEPVRDQPGGPVRRWIGTNTDISAQVAAEKALRGARDRMQGILDSMGEGFALLAPDYTLLAMNTEARRLDTRAPSELVGRSHWEAYPGSERSEIGITLKQAMTTRRPATLEHRYVWPDGRVTWLDMRAYPSPEGLAVFFRDVTDRRLAEDRLRELNATLEDRVLARTRERDLVWRSSNDLLSVIALDGTLLSLNPAWTTTLGWTELELQGRRFMEFVHPDDHDVTTARMEDLLRGEAVVGFENRYRHRAEGWRWLSWNAVPRDGMVFAAARDITAQRDQAEALRRVEEQLRQSQKMEAVGQLTGGLAHDFNNLLTGITGSLELLSARLSQGRVGELDRYATAAQGAARRAAALTHRLLAFSRRQTLDPRPTDANRLVSGMEELIRRTVGPAVTLEVVVAGGLWTTLVDPPQLESALLNLCINARDAMPDGGRLTIETGNRWLDDRAAAERDLAPGQYISLCVSDTGSGMSPEVAARAFDPFFTTKPTGMGTGLGLSMVYGFARQSGGQVRIYSEPGQGAMVCVYLPRHRGDAEEWREPAEDAARQAAGEGETVLVIDDEPTVRMLVADVLGELGYGTLEAADGAAGLEILRSDARVDLLITDVGLPGGMNGRQVADAGRALRPGLRVLFITGYAENAAVGNGHLEPGMHVLTKPFAMDTLASRVRRIVEGVER